MCDLKLLLCVFMCGVLYAERPNDFRRLRRELTRHNGHHSDVHYPGLGYFSMQPPFNNSAWRPLPPASIGTSFSLFTRTNPHTPDMLLAQRPSSIRNSHFNVNDPTKIIIHGFLQNGQFQFNKNMTRAFLEYGPTNVIVVSWGGGAGFPYSQAVANTRVVGAELARLIRALVAQAGVGVDTVHLIGHSLGAHVAGYAGARTIGLGRISGLDPAQPSYEGFDEVVRLDQGDARLVDVIHTDAIPYDTVGGYGYMEPVGHIDFFPNGGHHQPGCHEQSSVMGFFADTWSRGFSSAEQGLSCSHERSTSLFIDSITGHNTPCSFQAIPCASEAAFVSGKCLHCGNRPCPLMGFHADKSFGARGSFYLNTTATQPYCGHHFFVKLTLDPDMEEAEGELSVKLTGHHGESTDTVVASGPIAPGGTLTGLMLTPTNLGHVTSAIVSFRQSDSYSSYFRWSTHQVTLLQLEVNHVMRAPTKYFCAPDMTVSHGQTIRLTNGQFTDGHCQ